VLGLPPGSALQQYADLLADPPAAVGNELPGPDRQGAAASGWQADPRAQRGLMETGGSPRWVSWGVLPGADESRSDQEETPGQVVEEAPQVVEQVVEEAPGQVVEQLVESVETEAAPAEMLPEVAAEPVAEPAVTRTVPAPGRLRPTVISIPAPSAARAAAAGRAPATASAAAGRPAAVRRPAPRPAAGLGRRLAARVVDTVVMAVVAVAAGLPLASSATAHIETKLARATMVSNLAGRQMQVWLVDGVVLGKAAALLGILLLAGFLYEVLPTARTGQTFGKRLLGIRVIDARPAPRAPARRTAARAAAERPGPLRPPTVGRSFVRWIVRQLAAALVIGLCWPLLDRTARRGWQDRAARTKVVKA
jgi:uncharacterized RDD family membrane protein YckC